MTSKKTIKNYVSELDTFLNELRNKYPQNSESQVYDVEKLERIGKLRDNKTKSDEEPTSE